MEAPRRRALLIDKVIGGDGGPPRLPRRQPGGDFGILADAVGQRARQRHGRLDPPRQITVVAQHREGLGMGEGVVHAGFHPVADVIRAAVQQPTGRTAPVDEIAGRPPNAPCLAGSAGSWIWTASMPSHQSRSRSRDNESNESSPAAASWPPAARSGGSESATQLVVKVWRKRRREMDASRVFGFIEGVFRMLSIADLWLLGFCL